MFCPKCGNSVPDGSTFCNRCGAAVSVTAPCQPTTPPPEPQKKYGFFKKPTKAGKSYAAIATALMVFPATLCVAIDFIFTRFEWSSYVVGFLLVAWIVAVFPSLKLTPPAVNSIISFVAIICYFFYIAGKTGHFQWFYKYCLPLVLLAAVFLSVDASIFGSGKIKPLHVLSILSIESAIYLIAIEATVDKFFTNQVNIRWSLITACFAVSAVALLEAIHYTISINKKK